MYGRGFNCLFLHFAPPQPRKEGGPKPENQSELGGPQSRVCWGPQMGVCWGPPNQSLLDPEAPKRSVLVAPKPECPGGPQARVCLGAPEEVNPPLVLTPISPLGYAPGFIY